MRLAMLFFSTLCIGLGIYPDPLYAMLPYPVDYVPYTGAHVVTQLQLLLFSGLAFFVLLDVLRRTPTITLDVDWLYRRLGPALCVGIAAGLARAQAGIGRSASSPTSGVVTA